MIKGQLRAKFSGEDSHRSGILLKSSESEDNEMPIGNSSTRVAKHLTCICCGHDVSDDLVGESLQCSIGLTHLCTADFRVGPEEYTPVCVRI